ncbi:MAG: GspH/FimT family protein [Candidatus Rokuibacteriota bacterium]
MTISVSGPPWAKGAGGAGLTEVLVTVAIAAVVTAVSVPVFHTYLWSSSLRAGAEEFATLVNLARSLAIKENARACVNLDPAGSNRVRILVAITNPCRGAANVYGQRGLGFDARVDADGWIALQHGVAVTAASAEVVFTSIGAAAPGGTYTISKNGRALHVVVAPAGRVSVAP